MSEAELDEMEAMLDAMKSRLARLRAKGSAVDASADEKLRKREPSADAIAKVARLRRRKGIG